MKLKINIPLVFVTLCCFIISVSLQSVIAQTGDTTKVDPNIQLEKLREISLELVNQHQFTFILPNKKALKYEIKKEDKFFALPSGETRVVLFKLSDYEQPYTLVITSPCQCWGFNKKIFIPEAVIFDSSFNLTREVPDTMFTFLEPKGMKPSRLETQILIDEKQKDNRYLLIYTLAKYVGTNQETLMLNIGGYMTPMYVPLPLKGAAFGNLILEVKDAK